MLDLSSNHILDEGFRFLTDASFLSNLHKLYVNDAKLTHLSALYLRESASWGNLESSLSAKINLKRKERCIWPGRKTSRTSPSW